jgi:hypothetical protein
MCRIQRLAELHHQVRRPCGLEASLASKQLCERRPIHELHGEEELAVYLTDLVHGEDVRMSERRHDARLPHEACTEGLLRRQFRCDQFQGNLTLERKVDCAVHDSHSTARDQGLDAEAGKDGA